MIIDKSDGGNIGDYRITHNPGTGFRFRAGSGFVDSSAVTANTWHTVIAWHDAAHDTINIQVDNGTINTVAFSTGTTDTTYPLAIGAFPNGTYELDGRIDEVALYKRVLTPEERAWLYRNDQGIQGRAYAEVNPLLPAATTYTYGDANHDHAVTSLSNGNTYEYDANGNTTKRVIGTDTYLLSYDSENRLTEVTKNSAGIASFVYDADGKRVKSEIGSETTLFVGNYYQETTVNSVKTITKYYYAGATRIAMRVNGTLSYLFSDHLGSTSLVVKDTISGVRANDVVSELRYTAWGEVRYPTNGQNPGPSKYTYTGQYSNVDNFGLMFYGARWYDPYITQFSQPDSIVPDPYNPQSYDRYSYARNNPLRYTDPSGHVSCTGSNWDDGPQCVGTQEFKDNVEKEKQAAKIHKQFKNITIQNFYDWDLGDLNEIYTGLNNIMGKNGFNGDMDAFVTAMGEVTFVHAANESLGYQTDSNGNKVYNVATTANGVVNVTPNADMWNIVHEMGHVLSANPLITGRTSSTYAQMYSNVFNHTQPGTTLYGTTNSGEDFADSFYAVIRYGPNNMPNTSNSISPGRIQIITALIQSYTDLNQTGGK